MTSPVQLLSVLSLLFCALSCINATAQVTIGEFLGSALEDQEVQTFNDQIDFLNGRPYRLSPIREVEFRTQNRELMQTQQEFGLRVSPANPFEMRRQNEYFREYNNALSFEKEFALKEALTVRYLTVVDFIYYASLQEHAEKGTKNLEDQLNILEQQSGSRYFDPEDFVDLKIDHLDYLVEFEEIQFEFSNQLHRIARTYPEAHGRDVRWTFDMVVTPAQIRKVVDSLEQRSIKTSWVAYQEQKIRLAQSEYRLEKSNINLGFIQGSYDFRRFNQDRNPISISAGLTLPITNPNKGDMARRQLEVIEAEYDLKEEIYEAETDKRILSDKVRGLVERAERIEKRMLELRESNLPMTLSSVRDGNPVVLIQFTQNLDKLASLSLKVKRELFISYVEYLAFTDNLQQQPLINFLAPNLAPLSP